MSTAVDARRDTLLSVEQVREVLAASEPLGEVTFTVGNQVRFDVRPGWEFGIDAKSTFDLVEVYITVGGGRGKKVLQLTREALFQVTGFVGLPHKYAARLPAELLGPELNYWFRQGLAGKTSARTKDYKILTSNGVGAAITRQSLETISNLDILDPALAGIRERFGDIEILVDPKFVHSLYQTWVRLIMPDLGYTITRAGLDPEEWAGGLQIKNTLNGRGKTAVDGYLYHWASGAGAIDVRNPAGGNWVRKHHQSNDQVYEWIRNAVGEVLSYNAAGFAAVQEMTTTVIAGHASDVLRDVFVYYKVRIPDRAMIIARLAEEESTLSMYSVMQAIIQTATHPGPDAMAAENLMRLGGDLPHASTSQCSACRRLSHVH